MNSRTKNKAFTLIEIMVVVAIIGILAAFVIVNLSRAQARSRDTRRKTDLSQIAKAYQVYYQDKGTYTLDGAGATSSSDSTVVSQCGGTLNTTCGASSGHFNYAPDISDGSRRGGYSNLSLNKALINGGYISGIIDDPTCPLLQNPDDASELQFSQTQYCYIVMYSDNTILSLYAHMELSGVSNYTTLNYPGSAVNDARFLNSNYGVNFTQNIIP